MNQLPLILHDFFAFPGGGEKAVVTLSEAFQARLLTSHLDTESFPENYFDGHIPQSLYAYERFPWCLKFSKTLPLWWAFAHMPKTIVPWTVFSGSISLLGHKRIISRKILYCYTPPRLVYDQRAFYLKQTKPTCRPALFLFMYFYGKAYEQAVRNMDIIVVISRNIQARFKKYLGQTPTVVYPPCETAKFTWIDQEDYYLSTARADVFKRVEVIVRAFLRMPDKKLVVVSGGPELSEIKRLAQHASNIHILGWVEDRELRELMGRCIATIYIPKDEDFGISPVESMAAGKPVIGVAEGGLLETVVDGETGILINADPTPEDVIEAVRKMTLGLAKDMRKACEERAWQFRTEVFIQKMREILS